MIDDTQFKKEIKRLEEKIGEITTNPSMPDHLHTGYDASRVNFSDIYQKKVWIGHVVASSPTVASDYGVFYIVPFTCVLTKFQEVHTASGTNAGAVTVTLEKLTSTQAPGAGVAMLESTLSLKAASCSVQTGTLTNTLPNRNLAIGDRLALKSSGILTNVFGVTVVVELQIT